MTKRIKRLQLLKIKWATVFKIIFNKYPSFIVISIDRRNIKNLLKGDDYEGVRVIYRINNYVAEKMIKDLSISDDDLELERIAFELHAEHELGAPINLGTDTNTEKQANLHRAQYSKVRERHLRRSMRERIVLRKQNPLKN